MPSTPLYVESSQGQTLPEPPRDIVKSLRLKLSEGFPPRGSSVPAFKISMDGCYDYFHPLNDPDESDDPDDLYDLNYLNDVGDSNDLDESEKPAKPTDPDDFFEETEALRGEISATMNSLSASQEVDLEDHLTHQLSMLVFGSNLIERAGSGKDITLQIGQKVFRGEQTTEEIKPSSPEFEAISSALVIQNAPSTTPAAVLQAHHEVVQHCRALTFILNEMVVKDKTLSEELILQTHKILTYKVDSSDGESWATYGGQYRDHDVCAGFSTFTAPKEVPRAMKQMVTDFNNDLEKAVAKESLDPYMMAAKYCHKFVNIHPFADGNGRTCRLILNAILLKYAGLVVVLGANEAERDGYLAIAARASEAENSKRDDDDDQGLYDGNVAWGELASYTLKNAHSSMVSIYEKVTGKLVDDKL